MYMCVCIYIYILLLYYFCFICIYTHLGLHLRVALPELRHEVLNAEGELLDDLVLIFIIY